MKLKRTIASFLFCVFALSIFTFSADALYLGDLDADNKLTAKDARLVLRSVVGLVKLDADSLRVADVDGNGRVTASDARLLLRISVGLDAPVISNDLNGYKGYNWTVVDTAVMYTYDMLCNDLALFRSMYPDVFTYSSIGKTADGREIWCAVLGTGNAKKQIVADAGIHGSEYLNPAAMMSALEYYLKNYDAAVYNSKTVRSILQDTDLYLIPMLNPDGIAISQFGLTGLMTQAARDRVRSIYNNNYSSGNTRQSLSAYMKAWRSNSNGVDLNRNYRFTSSGKKYSNYVRIPANGEYIGDINNPENETAAYYKLINGLSNPVAVVTFHSQGNLIYWKCGQNSAGLAAAKKLANKIIEVTGYYLDNSDSFLGASADWAMLEKRIPAVTVESGSGSNPLPLSDQPGICNNLRNVFLAVTELY